MHELVVATLVESIATLPKAQRTKLALALKNKANIIHVKVAALRDAAVKIEGIP